MDEDTINTRELNELSVDTGAQMEYDNSLNDNNVDCELNTNLGGTCTTPALEEATKNQCVVNNEEMDVSVEIAMSKNGDFANINDNPQDEAPSACSDTGSNQEHNRQYSLTHFQTSIHIAGAWEDLSCNKLQNKFTKGCKWAPDGTCILTNSEDNILRIFNLPQSLYEQCTWQDEDEMLAEMRQAVIIKEGRTIYDYSWYPCMSSIEPLTCCVASCSQKSPVHLWDAFNGTLRATYNPINSADEVEAAYSVAFSPDGERLFCGFQNCLRIFNTSRPGRSFEHRKLKDPKLMPTERQAGIASCIAVNPTEKKLYAVASYLKTIGIYCEPDGSLLCLLKAHRGGITHLQYSSDGTKLYSGGRKDPEILCWDLRSPGKLLDTFQRTVTTNQRIYFDVSSDNQYLVSGNSNGAVTVYDLLSPTPPDKQTSKMTAIQASCSWQANDDCTNGVSLHPSLPVVATTAGQRHFDSSDIEDDEQVVPKISESCLKLWWVGPHRPTAMLDITGHM